MAHSADATALFVIGANHTSSSLSLRDRLFVDDSDLPGALAGLRTMGLREAILVSTCDRVEIWGIGNSAPAEAFLKARAEDMPAELSLKQGEDAIAHIFAVASGLGSMVIGEPQVLGQVKACHKLARESEMIGATLEPLMQRAYTCAKQVRTDTKIGEGPVSLAGAARAIAQDIHGNLDRINVLLLGDGEMGMLLAEQLITAGVSNVTVLHRRLRRAESAAQYLDCHAATLDSLGQHIESADVLIAALGARQPTVTADLVRAGLKRRRYRPMFILDLALPGDVEASVNRLDDAFLYDLADLERVAVDTMGNREQAAQAAWKLVRTAVDDTLQSITEKSATPAIVALRNAFEAARAEALAEGGDAEAITRRMVNRLLHRPSETLKSMAGEPGQTTDAERLLRRLFPNGDTGNEP